MSRLSYQTLLQRREGLTRDLPPGDDADRRWVTNSSTLILGEHDAVLVDSFVTVQQNDELVAWIRAHDRRLTHVYLTHGHGDHVFGVGQLLAAFPEARAVATAGTVAKIEALAEPGSGIDRWQKLFPGQLPHPVVVPDPLGDELIELEGSELRVVETGFTDTDATTALWVGDLGLVVAGDAVYNHTHPFLGETTLDTRREWIAALERLRTLGARDVVSGHKDPVRADDPSNIEETIHYLRDFDELVGEGLSAIELYRTMQLSYGRLLNPGSLWGAAQRFGRPGG